MSRLNCSQGGLSGHDATSENKLFSDELRGVQMVTVMSISLMRDDVGDGSMAKFCQKMSNTMRRDLLNSPETQSGSS